VHGDCCLRAWHNPDGLCWHSCCCCAGVVRQRGTHQLLLCKTTVLCILVTFQRLQWQLGWKSAYVELFASSKPISGSAEEAVDITQL
jgi:hypothetical protein